MTNPKLTAPASRAARGLLNWSVRDLMKEAGVSPNTVTALEGGATLRPETEAKIVAAFRAAGVEILPGAPGARITFRSAEAGEVDGRPGVSLILREGDPSLFYTVEDARALAAALLAQGDVAASKAIDKAARHAESASNA